MKPLEAQSTHATVFGGTEEGRECSALFERGAKLGFPSMTDCIKLP